MWSRHLSSLCYEGSRRYEVDGITQAGFNSDPRQQLPRILRDFHVLLLGPDPKRQPCLNGMHASLWQLGSVWKPAIGRRAHQLKKTFN